VTYPGQPTDQPPEPPPPPPGSDAPPPPPPGYAWGQAAPYGAAPYGAAPHGIYLDPASGLTLPQGVRLASPWRRIGAYFLAIPLVIVTLGIGYVIWGLVLWGRGQTPTYRLLGMRCWRPESGQPATFWWMALREIVGRFAEGLLSLISLLVSFILMVATRDRKCLHDLIAGTVVLHDPNRVLGP
jgi:uncharacterized RDD family membrane protein YckC